jgi:hypothetical protein
VSETRRPGERALDVGCGAGGFAVWHTDDIAETVTELTARGVTFDDGIADYGYGLVTHLTMPGGVRVQLYQPKYQRRPPSDS